LFHKITSFKDLKKLLRQQWLFFIFGSIVKYFTIPHGQLTDLKANIKYFLLFMKVKIRRRAQGYIMD